MKLANISKLVMVILLSLPAIASADMWAETLDNEIVVTRSANADTVLKSQLLTTYTLNPYLNIYPISVSIKSGVVTLAGKVRNPIEAYLAEGIAYSAKGVKQVINKLVVDPSAARIILKDNYAAKVNDLTASANIVFNLQKTPEVSPYRITVTTLNGVATLTGEVNTFEQKELASNIAAKTPGILMVNNNLKVVANP